MNEIKKYRRRASSDVGIFMLLSNFLGACIYKSDGRLI